MAIIDFGGVKERVITRKEFPMAKARRVLKGETIAVHFETYNNGWGGTTAMYIDDVSLMACR